MQYSNIFLLVVLFLSVQVSWTLTKVKQNALAPEQKNAFLSKLAPEMMKNHNQLKEKVMMKKQQEFETYDTSISGDIQDQFGEAFGNIKNVGGSPTLEDYQNLSDAVGQILQTGYFDDYPSYWTNHDDDEE